MRPGSVLLILFSLIVLSCQPVVKMDRNQMGAPSGSPKKKSSSTSPPTSTISVPIVGEAPRDQQHNRLTLSYCNQLTGLTNAYLTTMDGFFQEFRNYYKGFYAYENGEGKAPSFKAQQMRPGLNERQIELTKNFGAVSFLNEEQNNFMVNGMLILQKRLMDLHDLNGELEKFSSADAPDVKVGNELILRMNDHCAQFYDQYQAIGDFLANLQLANRKMLMLDQPNGLASSNILEDLSNIKSIIQRVGNYRKESDDLNALIAEYKTAVEEMDLHRQLPPEKIIGDKFQADYQKFYYIVVSNILPRLNITIESLRAEDLDWLTKNFNKTVEDLYREYNALSRFFNEEFEQDDKG